MAVTLGKPEQVRAPDLVGGGPWINSEPLDLEDLNQNDKVVMPYFCSYTHMDCLDALPHLREWWDKYESKGLMLANIHAPEFDFEKDFEYMEQFCREHDITWPVLMDNDGVVSDSYGVRQGPKAFLVDNSGIIRYEHTGLGAHAETEFMIQRLLSELDPDLALPEIKRPPQTTIQCFPTTPDLLFGYEKGSIGNKEGFRRGEVVDYKDQGIYEMNRPYLNGPWENNAQSIRHARITTELHDHVVTVYQGTEVNAVMRSAKGGEFLLYATLDGATMPPSMAGSDVEILHGESYVKINEPRLYSIIRSDEYGVHTLRLSSQSDEFEIYALRFGGCVER